MTLLRTFYAIPNPIEMTQRGSMRAEVKAFGRNCAAKRSTVGFGSRRKLSAYKCRLRQTGGKEEFNIGHHYLPKSGAVVVRQAKMRDVDSIVHFVNSLSQDGTLLHRTHDDVCANINSFTIAETAGGSFLGCAALYCYGTHLAEVRSIAVHPNARGKGMGHLLMEATLKAAQEYGIECLCLFTRIPDFFQSYGFHSVPNSMFPEKYNKDCRYCPRRNSCDETAMIRGELRHTAFGPTISSSQNLVQLHL
jgi:amino-acid N-acetyltransferase